MPDSFSKRFLSDFWSPGGVMSDFWSPGGFMPDFLIYSQKSGINLLGDQKYDINLLEQVYDTSPLEKHIARNFA